jgi:FAD/FMN-containing dehydrogenase
LAIRGKRIGITTRGSGSSYTGASIGKDIVLATPAHLNKITEIDLKKNTVTVQSGANFGKLQQTLFTHGRWIPGQPVTSEYSTVGGAVANNSSGINSVKYGKIGEYVRSLRCVLSNGDQVEFKKLSKREYHQKLGGNSMEAEIYRAVDKLLEENAQAVANCSEILPRSTDLADLRDVRCKDGSFNLAPLIAGSQGTLAIITDMTLDTEIHNPETALAIVSYSSREQAVIDAQSILKCNKQLPSSYEFLDKSLLDSVRASAPALLQKYVGDIDPEMIVIIQNDNPNQRSRASWLKKLAKICHKSGASVLVSTQNSDEVEKYLGILDLTSMAIGLADVQKQNIGSVSPSRVAVPAIESAVVPSAQVPVLINKLLQAMPDKSICIWGSLSDGVVRVWPKLDLNSLSDRQWVLKLRMEYSQLVMGLDGSVAGPNNIGRWYAQSRSSVNTADRMAVEQGIKDIFDPQHIFNPGVRLVDGTEIDDIAKLLRTDLYNQKAFAHHLPR